MKPKIEPIGEPHTELSARSRTYDSLFEHSLDCVKLVAGDGRLLRINQCGCDSLEVCAPENAIGQSYFEFWSGVDAETARAAARQADEAGSGRFTGRYHSPSGRLSVWDEMLTSIRSDDGSRLGYLIISRDITEITVRLEQQRALAELGSIALSEESFDNFLQTLTEVLARILHCPMTKVLQFADEADLLNLRAGVGWRDGLVGKARVGIDQDSQAGYTLNANEPVLVSDLTTETRFSGPLLLRQHNVKSGMSVVIAGNTSRPFGVLGVHSDKSRTFSAADATFLQSVANIISSRWRQDCADRNQKTLLRELAHRAGNLLQVADSIFRHTIDSTPELDKAKEKYSLRLGGMARSCSLIARGGWEQVSLRELAEETLKPFEGRIALSGRDIVVGGELAFDLGLVWHELATNSAKYGSLSQSEGVVDLSWSISRTDGKVVLEICWSDQASPGDRPAAVVSSGFGNVLIEQLVTFKHGGTVSVETGDGYRCILKVPLA
ncbi:sensor histidine kinase [Hyphobacterium marinum]|uniref:histidine kinase n=1 Tax=Hyphobacterium marinum TaxID=3116574 RepID=A0ABU7LXL4_9PROT|nr:HWE histidine kinase domain-containing protein [Hyphobacterium sp. Y6023]MEE2566286.1 HWE histidine kinase domain-containing protein [Hyphobacterium sp. Y6023]